MGVKNAALLFKVKGEFAERMTTFMTFRGCSEPQTIQTIAQIWAMVFAFIILEVP